MAESSKRLPIITQSDSGLTCLETLDKFFSDHQFNKWENFSGKDCYPIVSVNGKLLFFVQKLNGKPGLLQFGESKNWISWIYDNSGQGVFTLEKLFCLDTVQVYYSGDIKIGTIIKKTSWHPTIHILDDKDVHIMTLKGSLLGYDYQHKFKIFTIDNEEIGLIKRTFSKDEKDYFSNDNYVTTFPLSLDSKYKALLLVSMILIEFTYSKRSN